MENVVQGENTLAAYRQMISSGIDPYANMEQVDAAPTQEVTEVEQQEVQENTDTQETVDNADLSDDTVTPDDEPITIPQEQQTAFQKALEREKRKAREAAEKKFKEQYETEYSTKLDPYKKAFEQLGITPEQAMQAIEQSKKLNSLPITMGGMNSKHSGICSNNSKQKNCTNCEYRYRSMICLIHLITRASKV